MEELASSQFCDAIRTDRMRWSDHFGEQVFEGRPDKANVRFALCDDEPEILETSPEDRRGPSCVISGFAQTGRMLHVLCSIPPKEKAITAWWPDTHPWKWTDDFRSRRQTT